MQNRTVNIYQNCPTFETPHFILRFVRESDAESLLKCYSDKKAQLFFNGDNCTSDFCYSTLTEMQECIKLWLMSYEQQVFVRFSIVDKSLNEAIGTIEMLGKVGKNESTVGILRIDICSEYENKNSLTEIINVCLDNFYDLFNVNDIVTKAIALATERIEALEETSFKPCDLVGRSHYFMRSK